MSSRLFYVLVLLIIFTRLVKLDWGNGHFFHPDENNMASAISRLSSKNLDPKFYAYGQFPLYLTYFSFRIFSFLLRQGFTDSLSFTQSILLLRFWSAFFSILSIFIFYLISRKIFKKLSFSIIFLILLIFNPGLIQFSHFGTTEAVLNFVFAINILVALIIPDLRGLKLINYILISSIINGIGLASKITSIILTGPIFLSLFYLFIKRKNKLSIILLTQVFIIFTFVLYTCLSPFSIISRHEFLSSMSYETSVATGKLKVFYTTQFLNSKPYLFQFTHIFPYVNGVPVFLLSFFGFFNFSKKVLKSKNQRFKWLIIVLPSLVYFLYMGQLYTKWTRFMAPVFFVFPFFASYFLHSIKSTTAKVLLTILSVIPGVIFLSRYFTEDIRIIASGWVNKNIPEKSTIISEGGNVIDFPLNAKEYNISHFNFYDLDENVDFPLKLERLISDADYIFVPSRRIFKNQYGSNFPYSNKYYRQLFSGVSGFKLIKIFSGQRGILNPENAEETWTVFDHPTIRIFQKNKQQK